MTEERVGDWMQTKHGRRVYPLDPRPEDVHLDDVFYALPNINRFLGHSDRPYSVGEHSLLMFLSAKRDLAPGHMSKGDSKMLRTVLLHDGPEAFICDIPRPFKRAPQMAWYRELEDRWWSAFAAKFDLFDPIPEFVKQLDNRALMTERRDIVSGAIMAGWTGNIAEPFDVNLAEAEYTAKGIEAALWRSWRLCSP